MGKNHTKTVCKMCIHQNIPIDSISDWKYKLSSLLKINRYLIVYCYCTITCISQASMGTLKIKIKLLPENCWFSLQLKKLFQLDVTTVDNEIPPLVIIQGKALDHIRYRCLPFPWKCTSICHIHWVTLTLFIWSKIIYKLQFHSLRSNQVLFRSVKGI